MSLARDIADLGSSATRLDTVGSNVVINGAMNVAQRSSSVTGIGTNAGAYHTLDRWKLYANNTAGRLTMSQASDGPSGFANCLKFDCTTADTSIAADEALILITRFEGQDLQRFAKGTSDAKPFAVSFYVKGDANATYVCELRDEDNTRIISKLFSVTTAWTRVEIIFPADTTGAFTDDNNLSLSMNIFLHAGSNYTSGTLNTSSWAANNNANRAVGISSFFDSTNREFFLTGVQLEETSVTDFEHRKFSEELRACQRYAYVVKGDDDDHTGFIGYTESAANARFGVLHPVPMRAAPSFTFSGTCRAQGGTNDSANFTSGLAIANPNTSNTGACVRVTGTSGMGAADRGYNLQFKANGSSFIFDAEL